MDKLIFILRKILNENETKQIEILIKEFQKIIWDNQTINNSDTRFEIFSGLAQDLDYYEPNPIVRKENFSYFGNEKLKNKISKFLKEIEKL